MTQTQQGERLKQLKQIIKRNEKSAIEEYLKFLRFASVSTDSAYKKDLLECLAWLDDYVKRLGFHTEIWETSGHPVLFASRMDGGPNAPTLLIYNHYDVQPVDPIEGWDSPPFEPVIKEGEVFARGACDNKGQCFYVLQALKTLIEANGKLPINIKLCIEGEEEIGSAGLSILVKTKQKELKADYLAIVDLGLRSADMPAVTLGTRGIVTFTVNVEAANGDLHSGSHGGLARNPLQVLSKLLSTLHDEKGRVTVPHFYDDVASLKEADKELISFAFDANEYRQCFGASPHGGESDYAPLERVWTRPTLEINGITGGYGGVGFKTVLPAKAIAKISCRLVPDQNPEKIGQLIANHLEKIAPKDIRLEVVVHPGKGAAMRTTPNSRVVQAFAKAYQEVFEVPTEFIYEGGSIPIVPELAKASGAEVVLMGLGLSDDKIHAPNEHFSLKRIERGTLVMARAIELLQ